MVSLQRRFWQLVPSFRKLVYDVVEKKKIYYEKINEICISICVERVENFQMISEKKNFICGGYEEYIIIYLSSAFASISITYPNTAKYEFWSN